METLNAQASTLSAVMYSADEVAAILKVSKSKAYQLIKAWNKELEAAYTLEKADEQYQGIMVLGLQGLLIDRGINQENAVQLAAILQGLLSFKFENDLTIAEKIADGHEERK